MTALEIRGLRRAFGDEVVLEGLDLSIAAGEFVALLGRSGSGKSTLLRTLAGLDRVGAGVVRLPKNSAVVFQEHRLLPWKTVADNVGLGYRGGDRDEAVRASLQEVGLTHRAQAWPATLSGGEAQRAALARALVRRPDVLLLDEPFAALDALTRIAMHGIVGDLWRRHEPAVLLVTHDVWEAITLANRILILDAGKIAFEVAVASSRPRRRDDPVAAALESTLLAKLGVDAQGPPHHRAMGEN